MALESGSYINALVATNPLGSDPKSSMDDHLRLIKSVLKNSFAGITGAVTATQAELNWMVGATIQPAMKDGSNLTTPTPGDSSTKIATTAFVAGVAFASSLPSISAPVTGYFVTNNGSTGSWSNLLKTGTIRWSDSTDATKLVALSLSGLTTGTTRTITVPDRDVTLGGFSNMLVISSTQTWVPPAGVTRAKISVVDGGNAGSGSAGRGGNASISVVTVSPSVTYTATVGSAGVAPGGTGNASSFSGSGLTTRTSSVGDLLIAGGVGPVSQVSGGVNSYLGGASLLALESNGAGSGPGGGGAAIGGTPYNGAAGAIVIEY